MIIFMRRRCFFSQPFTAQRCRSETEKNILEDLSSSVLLQFKKYQPSGNMNLII